MNSSPKDDSKNEQRQRSEHSYSSDPSNREEVLANNHEQHVNAAAMPYHYSLPRYVDHTYRDFSTYIKDGNKIEKHKKCDRNFPALVHSILSNDQYSHIISWMPHGRAWKIHDKELLMEEIAPKFFGQSKYASFARQLSGWGFKRLHQTGVDFGCYYHECFLRGHPKLTVLMRRVPPGQGKGTPNMNAEPDFYKIAKHFPLVESSDKAGTDDERAVKKACATFSESEKWNAQHFEVRNEASGYKEDGGDPLLNRKAAAMDRMPHQHEWDPYQPVGAAHHYPPFSHPQYSREGVADAGADAGADLHEHGDNSDSANHYQPTMRHSFASTTTDSGADKNDEKVTVKPHYHDRRIHDPSSAKYHQQQPRPTPHRERVYSDPFPTPNPHFYPSMNSSYATQMHQTQQDQTPYHRPGSNINQYASFEAGRSYSYAQHYHATEPVAMTAAPPYHYYPTLSHYSQNPSHYQDSHAYTHAHGINMPNPNYDYRQRYLHSSSDHQQSTSQGQRLDHSVQGYFLPPPPSRGPNSGSTAYTIQTQATDRSEAEAPGVGEHVHDRNHNSFQPLPNFSPLRSSHDDESPAKESDTKH